jgi:hypothetical protein|tara:strand:- start:608 stop:1393 length:786 start_codon:yes stop_codon:yes gene_type:complete
MQMKKQLSLHKASKRSIKDLRDHDFGHYLAGLIDGDGHISSLGHIVISFNTRDERSAFELRTRIGFGKLRQVKNKNAINLIISNKKGVVHVSNLIMNKIKHPIRISQFNERLCIKLNYVSKKTSLDISIDWDSFWFSGFMDADGYLRIYIPYRKHIKKHEVRLLCQIDQKTDKLLRQIQSRFGGFLGYRKTQDTFYYSSVSFESIFSLLRFFDIYSLQNTRSYLRYTIIRKAYLVIQKDLHLTSEGLEKLFSYKKLLKDMI